MATSGARRSLGGAGRRNKGKQGEREVVALLQPVVNEVYVAHGMDPPLLERNLLQSHLGGCDIHGLEWLAVEVKYQEFTGAPPSAWWKQAVEQAGTTKVPVLFYRRSRMDWRVVMHAMLCPGCTAVATVDTSAFLAWFRLALTRELVS